MGGLNKPFFFISFRTTSSSVLFIIFYLLFFCFVFLGTPSKLFSYTVLSNDSSLRFKAYQFKRLPTNGEFHDFSAQLAWPDSIRVSFDVKSIDTKNKTRDRHLRSPDFLDAKAFPQASFVSTSITKLAGTATTYTVEGKFTLKDNTKLITFPIEAISSGNSLLVTGETMIDRFDYGVSHYKRTVDKKVDIFIDFLFFR